MPRRAATSRRMGRQRAGKADVEFEPVAVDQARADAAPGRRAAPCRGRSGKAAAARGCERSSAPGIGGRAETPTGRRRLPTAAGCVPGRGAAARRAGPGGARRKRQAGQACERDSSGAGVVWRGCVAPAPPAMRRLTARSPATPGQVVAALDQLGLGERRAGHRVIVRHFQVPGVVGLALLAGLLDDRADVHALEGLLGHDQRVVGPLVRPGGRVARVLGHVRLAVDGPLGELFRRLGADAAEGVVDRRCCPSTSGRAWSAPSARRLRAASGSPGGISVGRAMAARPCRRPSGSCCRRANRRRRSRRSRRLVFGTTNLPSVST